MGEKYYQIKDGKPEAISKAAAAGIPGKPADEDLCEIEVKPADINHVIDDPDKPGEKTSEIVKGFDFNCKPTDDCTKKNKDVEDRRKKLRTDIKTLEDKKHHTSKETETLTKLRHELAEIPPDCELKFIVGTGGDDKPVGRLTPDQIKDKKIEYAFCLCHKEAKKGR